MTAFLMSYSFFTESNMKEIVYLPGGPFGPIRPGGPGGPGNPELPFSPKKKKKKGNVKHFIWTQLVMSSICYKCILEVRISTSILALKGKSS